MLSFFELVQPPQCAVAPKRAQSIEKLGLDNKGLITVAVAQRFVSQEPSSSLSDRVDAAHATTQEATHRELFAEICRNNTTVSPAKKEFKPRNIGIQIQAAPSRDAPGRHLRGDAVMHLGD